MKIKAIKNKNISSFEFTFDLSKDNTLSDILKLYKLEKLYICIYNSRKFELNKYNGIIFDRYYENDLVFIADIMAKNIGDLLKILQGDFEELLVWNCHIDFDQFIAKIITPSNFLSLKKAEPNTDDSQFYLSFNHIDDIVEIICDINIDNNVSKEILNELLKNNHL